VVVDLSEIADGQDQMVARCDAPTDCSTRFSGRGASGPGRRELRRSRRRVPGPAGPSHPWRRPEGLWERA